MTLRHSQRPVGEHTRVERSFMFWRIQIGASSTFVSLFLAHCGTFLRSPNLVSIGVSVSDCQLAQNHSERCLDTVDCDHLQYQGRIGLDKTLNECLNADTCQYLCVWEGERKRDRQRERVCVGGVGLGGGPNIYVYIVSVYRSCYLSIA